MSRQGRRKLGEGLSPLAKPFIPRSSTSQPSPPPALTYALKTESREYLLGISEVIELAIEQDLDRVCIVPSSRYERLLALLCSSYYGTKCVLTPSEKIIFVTVTPESQIPYPHITALAGAPPAAPDADTAELASCHNAPELTMWVGNVPDNVTHGELWQHFSQPPPSHEGRPISKPEIYGGVASIHVLPRERGVFVRFNSEIHLKLAIRRFDGLLLRPGDPLYPGLRCRRRKETDYLPAGVAGPDGKVKYGQLVEKSKSARIVVKRTIQEPYLKQYSECMNQSFPRRYFVMQAQNEYDISLSIKRGVWTTQKNNEAILEQAYRTSTDVFLVFSVIKSGEFCGYGRMAGPILIDRNTSSGWEPGSLHSVSETPNEEDQSPSPSVSHLPNTDHDQEPKARQFSIHWLRFERLPFFRVRHLRNPWNLDREVKVSRDGTEIEPSVGEQLLDEWNLYHTPQEGGGTVYSASAPSQPLPGCDPSSSATQYDNDEGADEVKIRQ
ncbi:YTH-domain-containing protein [Auriscalpium vulgare]|uniref:YTH-domain-containing protein n=1 Tax=Auriscalpium vulgare TaxID=40419 RepID=A0ACB8RNT2_9AGAM|nr:YTH-domain-containing protein [Auriscalpium vulgare]